MAWLVRLTGFAAMLSPEIKAAIRECVDKLADHAKKTALPVDDVAVACLKGFLTLIGLY